MDLASIGSASIDMHLMQTQQSIGISLLRKAMDSQEIQAVNLIDSLQTANPSFGHQLDVTV